MKEIENIIHFCTFVGRGGEQHPLASGTCQAQMSQQIYGQGKVEA
jgi:hypothetical protein